MGFLRSQIPSNPAPKISPILFLTAIPPWDTFIPMSKTNWNEGVAVLVTTEYRGVFFGYVKSVDADVVYLRDARNCSYWSANTKGFVGLASDGPDSQCRIGPAAPEMELRKVTSIARCSDAAVERWESAPWG